MGCGCEKKKAAETQPERIEATRLAVTCGCGLQRLIPEGIQVGEVFRLVSCPRCGSLFRGRLVEPNLVEGE